MDTDLGYILKNSKCNNSTNNIIIHFWYRNEKSVILFTILKTFYNVFRKTEKTEKNVYLYKSYLPKNVCQTKKNSELIIHPLPFIKEQSMFTRVTRIVNSAIFQ